MSQYKSKFLELFKLGLMKKTSMIISELFIVISFEPF